MPDWAYVPGKTPRHPETWFDALKIDTPSALHAGLVYFNAGYFWECHEMLEAVWMETANPSSERDISQAIIQLANARLKIKMDRPKAAQRLCDLTAGLLDRIPADSQPLGQSVKYWRATLSQTQAELTNMGSETD